MPPSAPGRRGRRARWQGALAGSMAQALRPALESLQEGLAGLRGAGLESDPRAAGACAHLRRGVEHLEAALAGMAASGPAGPAAAALLDFNGLLAELRPWAETTLGPGIQLRLELAPELPQLPLPRSRLEPLVMNLLLNARDALNGSGEIRIRTGLPDGPDGIPGRPPLVYLEVQDDGPGIPPRVQERMFEPFFSTRPGRLGLGLAVVRGIAESCGGTVQVRTGVLSGAALRVTLPAG